MTGIVRLAHSAVLSVVAASLGMAQDTTGTAARRTASSIDGTVFDSVARRPLVSATVQLVSILGRGQPGEIRAVATDTAGRYRFDEVPVGTYLIGFQHLSMDTLGFRPEVRRLDLRQPASLRVALAVPSMTSIVRTVCGKAEATDSVSLLVGTVRHATNDAAIPNAFVVLRWAELFLTNTGLVRQAPTHDLYADDEGWFRACVPSGTSVTAHAEVDTLRSGDVDVTLSMAVIHRRDLYVGDAERAIVSANDSVRTSGAINANDRIVMRGRGSVRGQVKQWDGRAVAGARVQLVGGAGEARADDEGRFTLQALPFGSHTLEARALGFVPSQVVVDVVEFRENVADFALDDLKTVMLDTMNILAARRLAESARAGFERRRKGGSGIFLDESQIDTLRPVRFGDLLRAVPGVRLMGGRGTTDAFDMQIELGFSRGAPCPPSIFLDGQLLLPGLTDLDQIVNVNSIRRLEVYHRGAAIPAELRARDGCGALVVWTGPRLPRPPSVPNVRQPPG